MSAIPAVGPERDALIAEKVFGWRLRHPVHPAESDEWVAKNGARMPLALHRWSTDDAAALEVLTAVRFRKPHRSALVLSNDGSVRIELATPPEDKQDELEDGSDWWDVSFQTVAGPWVYDGGVTLADAITAAALRAVEGA